MTLYEKPIVIDDMDAFEGVYATSGRDEGWTPTIRWEGHNTGSHSEVQILMKNDNGQGGNYLTVTLTFNGNANIVAVDPPSNAQSYSWNSKTITVIKEGVYNGGENVSIMLPSVKFDQPSYDKNSVDYNGQDGGWSYYKSDDPNHAHIETNDWTVSYYYSM